MSTELVIIPQELESMSASLPNEKKNEIVSAVKNVFENVQKMRVQLEAINVADENDKVSMKLANTVRMAIRSERLAAEKFIDSKRETVQMLMSDFKTEDALWLKTKQLMQIETKSVEDLAKYKEMTGERIVAERKARLTAERMLEVSKYTEFPTGGISEMSQVTFDTYLAEIKAAYEYSIEMQRKAEAERLAAIEAERLEQIRIKEENARLQAEAEQKEKELAVERAKAESERKALEEKAHKEREEAEAILRAEQEKSRIEAEKAAKEKAALEAELKAKQQAEAEAVAKRNAEILAEEKAKAKAAKAPFKEKANKWVESFILPEFSEMNTTTEDIKLKFESYKSWAKSEIEKL